MGLFIIDEKNTKMNQAKIDQIKSITIYANTKFHGNTKKIGLLSIDEYKEIVYKKYHRFMGNYIAPNGGIVYSWEFKKMAKSDSTVVRELLKQSARNKGTNYFKTLIIGNTGIYYASPLHGHRDYNKSRVFDINTKTIKLTEIFNNIINK